MFIFGKKAAYPRDWPKPKAKTNQPNCQLGPGRQISFTPLTVTIVYDPAAFTVAQKAYLLSMFKPEQPEAFFVPLMTPLGQALVKRMQLTPGSYLLFASQTDLTACPLFLPNRQAAELDTFTIDRIACAISAPTVGKQAVLNQ